LFMRTEGEVDAIDGYGTLTIQEADANATGELTVWVGKPNVSGQINVELGADGQVTKLAAYKRDLVDRLGVAIESNFNPNTNWVKIDDPAQQVIALNGLSEMLGLGQWRGLDLRLTASGLYAAMGHRDFDPFGALVPQK